MIKPRRAIPRRAISGLELSPDVLDALNDPEVIEKLDYIESRLETFTEKELEEFAEEFAGLEYRQSKSLDADLEFRALIQRLYDQIIGWKRRQKNG